MVFGHLVARQGPHGVVWYEKARILVYLFHMPFFMYLSGYVMFRSGAARTRLAAWPALARRRAARLLLPFLLFGLAILVGKFVAASVVPVDNVPSAPWVGLRALLWNTDASPATSVWYLAVLFVFSVATPLLARWRATLALGAALLFLLPLPPVLYADRMGAYLLFFVAGGLAADAGWRWLWLVDRARWVFLLASLALLAGVYAGLFAVDVLDGTRTLGYRLLMLTVSAAAIPALHGAVRNGVLARSAWLLWLGGASFAIYLLNTICIGATKGLLLLVVSWDGAGFLPFAMVLMAAGTFGPVLLQRLAGSLPMRMVRAVGRPASRQPASPVAARALTQDSRPAVRH